MSKYCDECGQELQNKDLQLVVILDESGSMYSNREATISSVNEFIQSQNIADGETWVTLVKFADYSKVVLESAPIQQFEPLTVKTYVPNGCTALFDAIGDAVNKIRVKGKEKVMVVIMTDGEENASRKYTFKQIQDLVAKYRKSKWEFVFLGADIDSYAVGGSLNIATTVNWINTGSGVRNMSDVIGNYATSYRTTGMTVSSAALQADLDAKDSSATK
jgi:Mg-chelatase subunit ChlD